MLACLLALLTYLLFRDDVFLQHGAALQPSADTSNPYTYMTGALGAHVYA